MTMREQTCCFTGHRHIPSTQRRALVENLEETVRQLIDRGIRYFGAGGALGFDTLAARMVLGLAGEFPHIRLILVLPCPDQTRGWREADVAEYERIKAERFDFRPAWYRFEITYAPRRNGYTDTGIFLK